MVGRLRRVELHRRAASRRGSIHRSARRAFFVLRETKVVGTPPVGSRWRLFERAGVDNESVSHGEKLSSVCLVAAPAESSYEERQRITSSYVRFVFVFDRSGSLAMQGWKRAKGGMDPVFVCQWEFALHSFALARVWIGWLYFLKLQRAKFRHLAGSSPSSP